MFLGALYLHDELESGFSWFQLTVGRLESLGAWIGGEFLGMWVRWVLRWFGVYQQLRAEDEGATANGKTILDKT